MTNHTQYQPSENRQFKPVDLITEDFSSSPNIINTDKGLIIKNVFEVDNTNAKLKGGQSFKRFGFSGSAYSALSNDYLIGITSLALAPTIGLPRPKLVGNGKAFIVKDEAGGAAATTITVVSQGEETIDGGANTTLTTNYQAKSFYTDGTNWFIY